VDNLLAKRSLAATVFCSLASVRASNSDRSGRRAALTYSDATELSERLDGGRSIVIVSVTVATRT
jgi:hypothetical protein